jgi:hypothetical protein
MLKTGSGWLRNKPLAEYGGHSVMTLWRMQQRPDYKAEVETVVVDGITYTRVESYDSYRAKQRGPQLSRGQRSAEYLRRARESKKELPT